MAVDSILRLISMPPTVSMRASARKTNAVSPSLTHGNRQVYARILAARQRFEPRHVRLIPVDLVAVHVAVGHAFTFGEVQPVSPRSTNSSITTFSAASSPRFVQREVDGDVVTGSAMESPVCPLTMRESDKVAG